MKRAYMIVFDQLIEGDASECIINAIACVDDDHWRGTESTVVVDTLDDQEEEEE